MTLLLIQVAIVALGLVVGALLGPAGFLWGAVRGALYAIATQLLTVMVMVFMSGGFMGYNQTGSREVYAHYLLISLLLLTATSLIAVFAAGKWQIEFTSRKLGIGSILVDVAWGLFGLVVFALLFTCLWTVRIFGRVTPDALRFFLTGNGLGDAPADMIHSVFNQIALPAIAGALLVGFLSHLRFVLVVSRKQKEYRLGDKANKWIMRTVLTGVLAVGTAYSFVLLPILGVVNTFVEVSTFIDEHYVEPTAEIMHFPQKPKNLVHIFMESIENSYYSKSEGGYLEESLMPQLAELTQEGVSFSNTDKFGGPYQTSGATHSIAGIFNMQAGVPMAPLAISQQWALTYTDLPNLGSILHDQGYTNRFMLGGNRGFHQMGDYFSEYGKFEFFDGDTARERGLVPPDYSVWWGIEDDKLYEYAKTELTELAAEGNPFYFILENADTHSPGGYLSPNITEFPSDSQYGNVVHYSQAEVVELVRWMQAQPWYEDTVIVITGDHRSKDPDFFKGWDPEYERTIVNIILNSDRPKPEPYIAFNRAYMPFDFFPTITYALGIDIDGERLGLGTNLYSGKPTVAEEEGVEHVRKEVSVRSKFYEDHLVHDLTKREVQENK
ncbi:MAG: LTA synthase family protein [Actinomycetaceae bacterium]|nr:LTA synthase family protein [Actinomycetaceae bacterium]